MVHRRRQGYVARAQRAALRQSGVAGGEIQPCLADIPPRLRRFLHRDRIAVGVGVLLNGDGVGAVRDRRAGENAHRFARPYDPVESGARRRNADLAQRRGRRRHIGGAHRIAVHRRDIGGRLGPSRDDRRCQNPPQRLGHGDLLAGQGFESVHDPRPRLGDGHQRVSSRRHAALQSPDLPPDLRRRRRPSIRIPRSTALHMS